MLINKNVSIHTNKISLVPYSKRHVSKYHEWMQDPDIRAATASEQLTLDEEYAMQRTWRQDSDKLTFVSCMPYESDRSQFESIESMVGDVNLFLLENEEDSGDVSLVGELELMIAEKVNQRKGLGKASLLVFVQYIFAHEKEILDAYFAEPRDVSKSSSLAYLRVKISETNARSISLFESLGFTKTGISPNFFGEWELRNDALSAEKMERLMETNGITGYVEADYHDEVDT